MPYNRRRGEICAICRQFEEGNRLLALYWTFLGVVGVLMIGAVVRWQSTAETDPEFAARQETFHLLGVLFLSAAILLVQTRFPLNSPPFYVCYIILVPLIGVAFVILRRLYRVYRQLPIEPSSHDRS